MTSSSQSSPHSASDRPTDSAAYALQVGLVALKRNDYEAAIAHLSTAEQAAPDRSSRLKAQIGLVKAYGQTGQMEEAIARCRPLCHSSNDQIRDWATRTLNHLTHRQQPPHAPGAPELGGMGNVLPGQATEPENVPDETGFIPFQAEHSAAASDAQPRPAVHRSAQRTGFPPPAASGGTVRQMATPGAARELAPPPVTPPDTAGSSPPVGETETGSPGGVEVADGVGQSRSWKQAGRAQKWGSLGTVDLASLWAVAAGSGMALLVLLWLLSRGFIAGLNGFMQTIELPIVDLREFTVYANPFPWVVLLVLAAVLLSPWGMGWILRQCYGCKPMTLKELEFYSPEAVRLLGRACRQRNYAPPALALLPDATPMLMSYGVWPRSWHIVASRGLLETLTNSEIATLYAGELNHLFYGDGAVLSSLVFMAQLPYLAYWQFALWGDRQHDRVRQTLAIVGSSVSYGLFRLLRWPALWLSRLRLIYSDRAATEMTGNPNGLIRALLKISVAMAEDVGRSGHTHPLLESAEFLLPVSHRMALTLGSLDASLSWSELLAWDRQPQHRWLTLNQSHPLLGDRIRHLIQYARYWRLEPEINLAPGTTSASRSRLVLQASPFLGGAMGLTMAGVLWLVGAIAHRSGVLQLSWMAGDSALLWGWVLTGLSLGSMIRINPFFPTIRPGTIQNNPPLAPFLADPHRLPIDSQPIRLQGTLIGRTGISNLLSQDLLLHSPMGIIKLHHQTKLGPLGHLLPHPSRLTHTTATPATVTGWLRRGATPWIDVHTIQLQRGRLLRGEHPIWAMILALLLGLMGAYTILLGGW